jgi:hypothetical protein
VSTRVVFLVDLDDQSAQRRVLAWLEQLGAVLVALVGPDAWRQAHTMVGNGEADVIVTADYGCLPGVVVATTAYQQAASRAQADVRGCRPVLRPQMVRHGGLGGVIQRPAGAR